MIFISNHDRVKISQLKNDKYFEAYILSILKYILKFRFYVMS